MHRCKGVGDGLARSTVQCIALWVKSHSLVALPTASISCASPSCSSQHRGHRAGQAESEAQSPTRCLQGTNCSCGPPRQAAALSNDDRHLAAAALSKTDHHIYIYDRESGQPERVLEGAFVGGDSWGWSACHVLIATSLMA